MGRVDEGKRLSEPAHPLDRGIWAGWGRLGHQPCRLGRRPLEMGLFVVEASEEEEEEESLEEALPVHRGSSMEFEKN